MRGIGFLMVVTSFAAGVAYASLYGFSWPVAAFVGMLLAAFILSFLLVRRFAYLVAALALLAVLIGGVRTMVAPTELPHEFEPLLERRIAFEGVLIAQPDSRESGNRLTLRVEEGGATTRVLAVAPPHEEFRIGDRVKVSGTLRKPEPFETDGGRTFAYDQFLAKDGVFAVIQPANVEVVGRDGSVALTVLRGLQYVRDGFIASLEVALPEPESALAAGLVAGGKQGLGKELLDAFTNAGLIHIVVLSGYNVMLVAEAVLRASGFLPRRLALLSAAFVILLFVLAAGAGAAAVRAGVMALLGLLARATNRTYAVLRALGVAFVLMLLWSPLLLVYDPGFQFSFLATLGLILLAPVVERWLGWIRYDLLRDVAASTFAAQIGVLPILLYHTGNLSVVSLAVNLVVLPIIPPAMALATIAAAAALVLPATLALLLGLPAYALLACVVRAAEFAASLPFAHVMVPAFPFWVVALAYAALGFAIYTAGAGVAPAFPNVWR